LDQTRVVLMGMPQMLREIVRAVVRAEPDLAVIGEFEDEVEALVEIEAHEAGVLITGLVESQELDFDSLLGRHPRLRVLAVSDDASEMSLHELRPHRQMLGEVSPETLLAVIRGSR
jgi:DNA-binding NarL/FixJ family response regulator